MRKEICLAFATYLKDEELEDLKAFVHEISALLEKHYGYKLELKFGGLELVDEHALKEADRTFLALSSRPSAKRTAVMEEEVRRYRAAHGDSINSYASGETMGKQFVSLLVHKRSLAGFDCMETLKLLLYYDICAMMDTGGRQICGWCKSGKVDIEGETLETVDASGIAMYAQNGEFMRLKRAYEAAKEDYEELRAQYEEKQADTAYMKRYVSVSGTYYGAGEALRGEEKAMSEILGMTAALRVKGLVNEGYRRALQHFMNGNPEKAFEGRRAIANAPDESGYVSYKESMACLGALQAKIASILPGEFHIAQGDKMLDAGEEIEKAQSKLDWYAKKQPRLAGLVFMRLAEMAGTDEGGCLGAPWFGSEVKGLLDFVRKLPGDHRFDQFRFTMLLARHHMEAGNAREGKLYLGRGLELIQNLSKEYEGLYDRIAGDTYLMFSTHYQIRFMGEEAEDMLFCCADRYKNHIARHPDDIEGHHRLAGVYKTLAVRFADRGGLDRAKEYREKAEEKLAEVYKADRNSALADLEDMYESMAESLQPEPGVSDTGEAEECLLSAMKACRELASLAPQKFKPRVGFIYDMLGGLFRRAGEYDEGMDYFRSAVAEYKADAEIFDGVCDPMLAKCYCSMFVEPQSKDLDEAIECLTWARDTFTAAGEKDPQFYTSQVAEAWKVLGCAQKAKGDLEDAVRSHCTAMSFYEFAGRVSGEDVFYIADIAEELSAVGEIYDIGKEDDEERKGLAMEFHLQAIGTAYCGAAEKLDGMDDTLQKVTSSYILSLLHPGFSALISLIYRYMSRKEWEDAESLANKAADYSDTRPDMAEEDEYVISQLLEAAYTCGQRAASGINASLMLVGAYHALDSQYESMGNGKDAKKYRSMARKLYREKLGPGSEADCEDGGSFEDDDWDDYPGDDDDFSIADLLSNGMDAVRREEEELYGEDDITDDEIREMLGEDMYARFRKVLDGEEVPDYDNPEAGESFHAGKGFITITMPNGGGHDPSRTKGGAKRMTNGSPQGSPKGMPQGMPQGAAPEGEGEGEEAVSGDLADLCRLLGFDPRDLEGGEAGEADLDDLDDLEGIKGAKGRKAQGSRKAGAGGKARKGNGGTGAAGAKAGSKPDAKAGSKAGSKEGLKADAGTAAGKAADAAARAADAAAKAAAEREADAKANASYDDILARFINGLDEDPNPDDSGPDGEGGGRS